MKKKKSMIPGMLMMAGGAVVAIMMYKKMPNMVNGMKYAIKDASDKVSNTLNDMINM